MVDSLGAFGITSNSEDMVSSARPGAPEAGNTPLLLSIHLLAAALALLYAWLVSNTRFVTTGLEFVAPLAVILAVHCAWALASGNDEPGFAMTTLSRTLATAGVLAVVVVSTAILAPSQAAAASTFGQQIVFWLSLIACLAVLSGIVTAAATLLFFAVAGLIVALKSLGRWLGWPPSGGGRLNDYGYLALAFLAIGASSIEGIVPLVTFSSLDGASSTVYVAAAPGKVWQAVGKATSPSYPLPVMLKSIPQPVAVLVDEGAGLGARRIVRFLGREGEGDLVLKVTSRTDLEAKFEAISDGSPIAHWVHQRGLTFRVEAKGEGTLLTVSSQYDRLLSPAWFFGPYIRTAAYLAVRVLATDTGTRAEAK